MLSTTKLQGPCDKNSSHYRASIQDLIGQSQELGVKDLRLKFQLNPTVKESEKSILLKLRISEKYRVVQRPSHSPNNCPTLPEYEK